MTLKNLALIAAMVAFAPASYGQKPQSAMDRINLDRARQMLRDAHDELKKHYYDTKYHGLDLEARYKEYDASIARAASLAQAYGIVATFLDGFNDSHTFFRPPQRPARIDYGFRIQMFGQKALIARVRPGTDAESKLKPGDEVLVWNKFNVQRDVLWKMNYFFNTVAPQSASNLTVRNPAGEVREVQAQPSVHQLKRRLDIAGPNGDVDLWQLVREEEIFDHNVRQRTVESDGVMIWKVPEFDMTDEEVDRIFTNARKHPALILDLRDNPGGLVVTLERMVGNVFDHDVKIADRIGRKELKPQLAKTRGGSIFNGKLIVLVDSASASAAELFARVIQLEKRGIVIGDTSSGSVMEARGYSESQGTDTRIFYSFSITDADLIMKDGKSLEHNGVVPDELVVPTPQDVAEGRDPALARAAEIAGVKLDPVKAGKMFPLEWLPL
ncbi:MAG TPA: S41 family peptidase [Bryobacteraceae bacterium]|nr:S41 family peptidase [Bryobacteraceae bacterium]